jgi:hypothetical protein
LTVTSGVISGLNPYSKLIEGYATPPIKPIGTAHQVASKLGRSFKSEKPVNLKSLSPNDKLIKYFINLLFFNKEFKLYCNIIFLFLNVKFIRIYKIQYVIKNTISIK